MGRRMLHGAPWIVILVLTGIVQIVRAVPVDAAIFLGVALMLVLDAAGVVRLALPAAPRPRALVAGVVLVVVWIVLTLAPRHGTIAGIAVAVVGLVALPVAWGRDRRSDGQDTVDRPLAEDRAVRRAAVLWAAIAVATCVWELTSFVWGRVVPASVPDHPSISELLDPVLDGVIGRGAFAAVWLAVGLALLRPALARSPRAAMRGPGRARSADGGE